MERSFNALVTTRVVQKAKHWKEAVVTFSNMGHGSRYKVSVVDEDGKRLLSSSCSEVPNVGDEIRISGMLMQIEDDLSVQIPQKTRIQAPTVSIKPLPKPAVVPKLEAPPSNPQSSYRTVDEIIQLFKSCVVIQYDKQSVPLHIDLRWQMTKSRPPEVPSSFESMESYKESFTNVVVADMNYRIADVFHSYIAGVCYADSRAPRCKDHGSCSFCCSKRGLYFWKCSKCSFYKPIEELPEVVSLPVNLARAVSHLHSKGIACHQSTLLRRTDKIILQFNSDKFDDVEYSKDDLWVVLNDKISPIFTVADNYGVYSNTRIELRELYQFSLKHFLANTRVLAIRAFNAQSDISSLNVINEISIEKSPVMESILAHHLTDPLASSRDIYDLCDEMCSTYGLNVDQRRVMNSVCDLVSGSSQVVPIVLVHGIFGSGKSHLLSVIVMFLARALDILGRDDKILISASTNVAVDNVLSNLERQEFTDFTRVGSVKKIRKNILPFVTGHGDDESINALEEISEREISPETQTALANANLEKNTKCSRIDEVRVTGVTCAATSFPVMQGKSFTFVLLDECSQQTEPISLLPISFGCRYLICFGDPIQLPPAVASASQKGFGRPMFTRLAELYRPIFLSMQYRCHPLISGICNTLFYDNKIVNGISAADRQPFQDIPTISLFDVAYGRESFSKGSVRNDDEAHVVSKIVSYFLTKTDVPSSEIGVIAFYKSQVEAISKHLAIDELSKKTLVDISTVDAFQGDERDVIIISTTRVQKSSFMETKERVNVAISRARRHLIIVTNVQCTHNSDIWDYVMRSAQHTTRLSSPIDTFWQPFD